MDELKTSLEYSLTDNKRNSPFEIGKDAETNKEGFQKYFFVDYPDTIERLVDRMSKIINGNSNNTIIFYGASGSGKSTFLNYYAEQTEERNEFHFVNLIEYPASMDYEECIRKVLLTKIYESLNEENNLAASLLYDYIVKQEAVRLFDRKEDNDLVFDYLVANKIEKENAEDYLDYIGIDGDGKFIRGANTNRGLVVLYLMLVLIKHKKMANNGKNVVFVFDNLDEIPTQYIYSHTYELIMSAFSDVQTFCADFLDFDFLGKCTFILSYRSTNAQIIDRCQLEDRQILSSVNVEFRNEYQVTYSRMLSKRIGYYCEKYKKNTLQDNEWRVRELLNSEKDYCTKVIRPLFNYDFRMFVHFFVNHLIDKGIDKLDDNLVVTPGNDQRKKKTDQTGARGVLLYYALESMLRDPSLRLNTYVNHEFVKTPLCNIYRMSFTILSNLGGWALQNDELKNAIKDENSFNDETPRISFYEFAKKVEKWYGKEMFKSAIDGLIGSVAFNFEYPVILVGGLVDDYFKNKDTKHSISGLARYIVDTYTDNESLLANVNVKINPLCVIYCWRVFIHFEYFNLISDKWANPSIDDYKYVPVPLYQITNEHLLKGCLNSVFATVTYILEKAEKHFCEKCKSSGYAKCGNNKTRLEINEVTSQAVGTTPDTCKEPFNQFIEDGFCINNTMYAVRVITSHLNYLDHYKTFIWGKLNDTPDLSFNMQTIVLTQMDKYLTMWKNFRVAENKSLLTKYRTNLTKAKESLEEMKCVSIGVEEDLIK